MNDSQDSEAAYVAELLDLLNASEDLDAPIHPLPDPSPAPTKVDRVVPTIAPVPEQPFAADEDIASLDDLETRFATYVGAAMSKLHTKE
jgi:hypothetical protein